MTEYVAAVHACAMPRSVAEPSRQGWDQWMDYHVGVVTTARALEHYHGALLAANVSFHTHAKRFGEDTIHAVAPCGLSIELNGEFESAALNAAHNPFDYCTWDTEAKREDEAVPDFDACDIDV